MQQITLKGRGGSKGMAEGEALVTDDPIGFTEDVDVMTGVIQEPSFKSRGECIAGKILVFSMTRGSTGGPYGLWALAKAGSAPKAIIALNADAYTVSGAVISHIPMVYQLDQNPMEVITTGDYVRLDGTEGTVTVVKKDR